MSEIDDNTVADIYRLLPGKNCGDGSPCGFGLCREFALSLLKGTSEPTDCPYLEDDNKLQEIILILDQSYV
jgi:CO dehydrogenase/acetyl-CoA synthase gamma subunit (corrinoid Fe-S protein)